LSSDKSFIAIETSLFFFRFGRAIPYLPLLNKGKRGKGHNITAFATLVEITQTHLV